MIGKWWKKWLGQRPANRAQRRAERGSYRPHLTTLEVREVPAAYVPDSYDHHWMGQQVRYLLGQETPPQSFTYSNQWVVGLTPASNNDSLASQFGAAGTRTEPLLEKAFIWSFSVGHDVNGLVSQFSQAMQDGLVAYSYPLLSTQMVVDLVPNDTLYPTQWHLKNTGQAGGTAGEDVKAEPGWDITTGAGRLIVVTDSGTQIDHPDLLPTRWQNPDEIPGNGIDDDGNGFVDDLYGWNFENNSNNPSSGDHGTAVTGLAAAKGNNALGVVGTAFNANWAAFKAIGAGATYADLARALTYKQNHADVYTNSWGIRNPNDLSMTGPQLKAAILNSFTNGRSGKGAVILFSAGNTGDLGSRSNYREPNNMRQVLSIAALEPDGKLSSYSTYGASIFVAAPAATVTTDETGSSGYNNGDYTTGFGGTSSSTPVVAGIVANIFAVNSSFGPRDVMHILARTSTKNDPTDSSWQLNGAKINTSNKYGFGRPDMGAALAFARNWKPVGPEDSTTATINPNLAIPDNDPNGAEATIDIATGLEMEWVEVDMRLSHPSRGDLEIALISPSGTVSILADPHNDTNPNYNWRFSSAQFWGERSNGTWKIRIRDLTAGNGGGVLQQVTLTIIGQKGQPPGFGNGGFLEVIPTPVAEGSTTVLSGRFNDPDGAGERHFVDVDWGDGTPIERYQLFIGQTTFNVGHRYLDNGSFTVSATVTDERGNGSTGSASVSVFNVAPSATIIGAPATALEGRAINLFGGVTDPGLRDTFVFSWNVTKNGAPFATGGNQAFSFTPDDQGIYRVNLTVVDDDGGVGVATQARIVVSNTAPDGTFTNDGPKGTAPQTVTFTFTPIDGAADVATMLYSYDFNNDGDFTDPGDVLNSPLNTATFNFAANGIYDVRGRMLDKDGAATFFTTTAVVGVPGFYNPTTRYYAAGAGVGMQPRVRVFNLNNTEKYNFLAYAQAFQGGVRVATGDVNGDGTEDIITVPGAGGGPHVKVFNGATGALLKEFMAPLGVGYMSGLNIAAGDLNSDAKADIILGTTTGRVLVIDGSSATNAILGAFNFQPIAGFTGSINVGTGDFNGDRVMDLVVGAGRGGPPLVQVFSYDFFTGAPLLRTAFNAFEASFRGGVTVAIGDVNGDGRGDIIVGSGPNGQLSRVKVFNGKNTAQTLWNFAPFPGYTGGIQVTSKDLDGDGKADILLSPNSGATGRVVALKGTNLRRLAFFTPFDPQFLGGVFVG